MTEPNKIPKVRSIPNLVQDARYSYQLAPTASPPIRDTHEIYESSPDAKPVVAYDEQEKASDLKGQHGPCGLVPVVVTSSQCESDAILTGSLIAEETAISLGSQGGSGTDKNVFPIGSQLPERLQCISILLQAIQAVLSVVLWAIPVLVTPFLVISILFIVVQIQPTVPLTLGFDVCAKHCYHVVSIIKMMHDPPTNEFFHKLLFFRACSVVATLAVLWMMADYTLFVLIPCMTCTLSVVLALDLLMFRTNGKVELQSLHNHLPYVLGQALAANIADIFQMISIFGMYIVLQGNIFGSNNPFLHSIFTGILYPIMKYIFTIWFWATVIQFFKIDKRHHMAIIATVETIWGLPLQVTVLGLPTNQYFWLTITQNILAGHLPRIALLCVATFPSFRQWVTKYFAADVFVHEVHHTLRHCESGKFSGLAVAVFMRAVIGHRGVLSPDCDLLLKFFAVLSMDFVSSIGLAILEIKCGFPQLAPKLTLKTILANSSSILSQIAVYVLFLELRPI